MGGENVNVAIIGAGISGLACAHELEKHGINPVIYERNHFIGDPYTHYTAILNITIRPIKDPIDFFKKKLDIELKPLNVIKRIIHHTVNERQSVIVGNHLGYFFSSGKNKEKGSFKQQLFSQLKNPTMVFNEVADYQKLSKKYDHVVVATGTYAYAKELGCWQEWVRSISRGAVVLGNFDPNTIEMWVDQKYTKNGYAYLCPYNEKRAVLVLVVTDVNEKELDHYWELFLSTENLKYTFVEEFKVEHRSGYVYPMHINNIFFVGNAAGGVEPFLGFGYLNSLVTGVMAGRAIALEKDYEKLVQPIIKRNKQMHEFRKAFNELSNTAYSILIPLVGLPGINQLIYKTPINIGKYGSYVLGALNRARSKDKG